MQSLHEAGAKGQLQLTNELFDLTGSLKANVQAIREHLKHDSEVSETHPFLVVDLFFQ
jgi:hypothetical protein